MGARDVALRVGSNGSLLPAAVMALSVAVFLLSAQPARVMAQQMALPGKAAVGQNGEATYSIPISVPPGTAGLAPTLSFQYNNQSGNGLLGLGWSLGGLPAVGRCPQTIAQDGVMGRVNYDANDRFCLDGQRLMAINNGTYGADGTEYRTEIESFSRVISHGTAGTGPAWFEVHTKSGQIMEFGNTADSQVLAQGTATARSWAVNKVSDTKGNYFTVTYTVDAPNGQAYPARIDYTANDGASLQPYNSAQFVYATRPDATAVYHAGSLMETTQRLTDVKTYAGTNLVADYQLAYSTTFTSVSILASITLCAGDGSCLPATTFTVTDSNAWAATPATSIFSPIFGNYFGTTLTAQSPTPVEGAYGGATFAYPNGWHFGPPPLQYYDSITGDFNADGKTDFAFTAWDVVYVLMNNGDGTFAESTFTYPNSWNFGSQPSNNYVQIPGDFNGDGKIDFAYAYGTDLFVMLGNGDGTFAASLFTFPNGWNFGGPIAANYTPIIGDINGDGRTDFAFAGPTEIYSFLSNGDGTFTGSSFSYPNSWNFGDPPQGGYWPIIGDFDGDGKTDFAFTAGAVIYVMRSNGDGTFAGSMFNWGWLFGAPGYGLPPTVGDFNGDGKTDIVFRYQSTGYAMLSKGDGTFALSTFTYPSSWSTLLAALNTPIVGDFNGDGKADFAMVEGATILFMLGNSDGSFSQSEYTYPNGWNFGNPPSANYAPITGDFNGDGKIDFAFAGGTTLYMLQATSSPPNYLLNTVTNGLSATTTFTYQPLTNSSVYTKGSGSTYPIADVQAPIYVVSRVDNSNGIGGNLSASYAYANAKTDYSGRGFLGFGQVTATDLQTNIVKTTISRQDYPYIAMVASETQALNSATLNTTTNTYGNTPLGGTRYQVFLTQSQASSTDLDGSSLPTVTTSYQYDAFGNATQIVVSASDGRTKTTTNTYTNDTVNWLLGRLTNATVTSVAPSPPPSASAPTITLSPASLPDATYGNNSSYNQTVSASGGTSPYTYSISSGSLPGGLSLNSSTGAITGVPTASGTSFFTIMATDANRYTGSDAYTLTVNAVQFCTLTVTTTHKGTVPAGISGNINYTLIGGGGGGNDSAFAVTGGYAGSAGQNVSGSFAAAAGDSLTVYVGGGGGAGGASAYYPMGGGGGAGYFGGGGGGCDGSGGGGGSTAILDNSNLVASANGGAAGGGSSGSAAYGGGGTGTSGGAGGGSYTTSGSANNGGNGCSASGVGAYAGYGGSGNNGGGYTAFQGEAGGGGGGYGSGGGSANNGGSNGSAGAGTNGGGTLTGAGGYVANTPDNGGGGYGGSAVLTYQAPACTM